MIPPSSPHSAPLARTDSNDVTVQAIYDELVIYDLRRHQAHSLNPTAALVWRWCDGATSPAEMAERLAEHLDLPPDQAEPLLWFALDRLQKARLLAGEAAMSSSHTGITRRQALKLLGGAVLLPVVYTLVAPTPAQAQTLPCTPNGGTCNASAACCSGCCKKTDNTCVNVGPGACL